jgi:beta-barrel assembly-enhancing protease
VKHAPFLKGGINMRRVARVTGLTVGSIAATLFAGWLLLTFAPQQLAHLLPQGWVKKTGANMERSFVEGHNLCTGAKGTAVLKTFAARLKEGSADFPEIELKVYDLGMINAFALPGGHVILSRQLIDAAKTPEEVAGVLAHEIGHVSHRHPEAQMIRVMGVQVLASMASGGGDTFGSVAAFLAMMRYSRDAEREADAFAREMMKAAAIDPLGFKAFFESIKKEEGELGKGTFGKLANILSTHPMTDDRIAAIQPLPAGVVARPVLSAPDWQALREICSSTSTN